MSLKKIWNLQNFAAVGARWDTLSDGRNALIIKARDALTVRPVIAGWLGSAGLATLRLGVADRNFLGRNIGLEIRGQMSRSDPVFGEIKLSIPRQLLWKNLAVGFGARSERIFPDLVGNRVWLEVANPFHTDYRYTFSPDLETGFLQHWPLPGANAPVTAVSNPWWYLKISESAGTITHRRHQKEGFCVTALAGAGIGLANETQRFTEVRLRAEYHAILYPKLQFSAVWTGYGTSASSPALWTRPGPSDLRGMRYGEVTGPLMQLASSSLLLTWVNLDWLAIEQSLFVQYAAACGWKNNPTPSIHRIAAGTGIRFTVPMFPAASILLSFSYNPDAAGWFYLEL
jgi:hypothetical protein